MVKFHKYSKLRDVRIGLMSTSDLELNTEVQITPTEKDIFFKTDYIFGIKMIITL